MNTIHPLRFRLLHAVLIAVFVAAGGCSTAPDPAPADAPHDAPTASQTAPHTVPEPPPSVIAPEPEAPVATQPMPPATPPAPPPPDLARVREQRAEAAGVARPASPPAPIAADKMLGGVRMPPYPYPQPMPGAIDRENYTHYDDNPVHLAAEQPVSTFGIDVDTGSYTNVRRMLEQGRLPPADAVRAEEFINYFDYAYAPPASRETPFRVTTEIAPAPWNRERQLLLVGIQGYRVPVAEIPAANLVFLVDTSGSMNAPDKLPLLQASLKQIVPKLRARDRIAIVTYAGNAGVALESTPGDHHARITAAIDAMHAGGSTNGQAGIELAYAQARQGFIEGGVNRVILATDGDFNVGRTGIDTLESEVAEKRRSGIALSTLGFGTGNYNDAMAVRLADAGNGSHHYVDNLSEARKVLVDEMSQTLLTIASDVKIQIEFNPARVREYRLIGYVKRILRREDFNNDAIDAGEIGAGANVTALYELTPAGSTAARIDPLRYGASEAVAGKSGELAWLRLRYKLPGEDASRLVERALTDADTSAVPSERLRFAAAVAAFAESLRGGKYLDGWPLARIAELARGARGADPHGYRAGFVRLVELADGLRTPRAQLHPDEETASRR